MRAGTAYSNLRGQEQLREGERPLGAARKGEEVDRVEKGEGAEEEMKGFDSALECNLQ